MEHWGIYIAYAWLATIAWAFADAVQAIRKGPQLQPQPSGPYAEAAPRLAPDIFIPIDAEPGLIFRWRRLATRESPRTDAGPRRSCAGHRGVGQ